MKTTNYMTIGDFKVKRNQLKNMGNSKELIYEICQNVLEDNGYLLESDDCVHKIAQFVKQVCELNDIELSDNLFKFINSHSMLSDKSFEVFDELINLDFDEVYKANKRQLQSLFLSVIEGI